MGKSKSKEIVVVGAGLGGIAAAIRLAAAGHRVEVWEKNGTPGGKLQEWRSGGYRWDLGPSLLTMPEVVHDLFAAAGTRLEDHLALDPLPLACRYSWRDGTVIDEDAAFWRRPEVARFLAHAKGIYDLSGEAYLNHPPSQFWKAFTWRNLPRLRHLPKVATLRTLAAEDRARFADPHLRQLFDRFATYNGSSPYKTPATFAIIPYVEARFGGWYVRGGMARLGEALAKVAEGLGVAFRYGTEARRWSPREGLLESGDGRTARPGALVCNQDVLAAAQTWLADAFTARERAALLKPDLACSGFVLLLGVTERYPGLAHHNIFFSDDYPAEFRAIFEEKKLPGNPTLYVASTARTDPADAPPGGENFFVLANAPALGSLPGGEAEAYADRIVEKLEAAGLAGLRGRIAVRRHFTSADFAARDGSHRGSLYGWASHSLRASLFRPPLWSRKRPGLFFAGGTTHPGGGIPLVLLSGKMVAERIAATA